MSFLFVDVKFVIAISFQSIGKSIYVLFMAASRQLLVLIPLAWYIIRAFGLHSVWNSYAIAEFVSFLVSAPMAIRLVSFLGVAGCTQQSRVEFGSTSRVQTSGETANEIDNMASSETSEKEAEVASENPFNILSYNSQNHYKISINETTAEIQQGNKTDVLIYSCGFSFVSLSDD